MSTAGNRLSLGSLEKWSCAHLILKLIYTEFKKKPHILISTIFELFYDFSSTNRTDYIYFYSNTL